MKKGEKFICTKWLTRTVEIDDDEVDFVFNRMKRMKIKICLEQSSSGSFRDEFKKLLYSRWYIFLALPVPS